MVSKIYKRNIEKRTDLYMVNRQKSETIEHKIWENKDTKQLHKRNN